ncbi:hypothetical protein P8452_64881 [Trifolium repens]|nr:hypothetical protein P8452_64881 [Trifolium repens]
MFFPAGRRHDEKHPWLFKANPTLQEWTKKLNNVRESKQADTSVISWFLCLVDALRSCLLSDSLKICEFVLFLDPWIWDWCFFVERGIIE